MAEIHLDFLNFNNILLLLVILAIGGYLYYEIHKMKLSMNDIHNKLNFLMNSSKEISLGEVIVDENEILSQKNNQNVISPEPMIDQSMNIQREETQEQEIREVNQIHEQMNRDILSEDSDDSSSESSDDSRSESSNSESRISQSEIEKDYGKNEFEKENNNASIDDILSDKHIITDNSLSDILNVDNDLKIDEFIQNIKNDKEESSTKDMSTKDMKDYNDMTVSELKKVLVDMKLPVSGNKTKLVERILENKK